MTDMEKSRGEAVILSTGLKDKEGRSNSMMDEEEEEDEEIELNDFETFSEEGDVIDEDDEEVARFSF